MRQSITQLQTNFEKGYQVLRLSGKTKKVIELLGYFRHMIRLRTGCDGPATT